MILSAQSIREYCLIPHLSEPRRYKPMITPFTERTIEHGVSYGLSAAGYDIRARYGMTLHPGDFRLNVAIEHFALPRDVLAVIHDKSTWARRGLSVFNSTAEPGWRGHLTLELSNRGQETIVVVAGQAIAHVVFHRLDEPTEQPYAGKYQDQPARPVPAIKETDDEGR